MIALLFNREEFFYRIKSRSRCEKLKLSIHCEPRQKLELVMPLSIYRDNETRLQQYRLVSLTLCYQLPIYSFIDLLRN